ncbi:MAG: hypothetical protein ACJAQ4_002599, partial [Cryomorphaceae bacterium]
MDSSPCGKEKTIKELDLARRNILMRILFYFPTSESSVSLETLMEEFSNLGHE